jgi:hypothetical protein
VDGCLDRDSAGHVGEGGVQRVGECLVVDVRVHALHPVTE